MKNPASLNKQFKLFWIGVGKDDTLTGPGDRAFDADARERRHHAHVLDDRRPSRVDGVAP